MCLVAGFAAVLVVKAAFAGSTTTGAPFMPHGSGAARNTGDYISRSATAPAGLNSPYRYFIEVPPGVSRLVVDIFDADVGLGGTTEAAAGRDRQNPNTASWDTSATYTLWNPAGVSQTTVFSQGNATSPTGSDNAWLTLYDSNAGSVDFGSVATATATSNTTSLTIARPSGTTAGDLLILVLSKDGSGAVSTPSGWTLSNEGACAGNACRLGVFWKVAAAGEPATYSVSWTGSEQAAGAVLRYTGADATAPINVVSAGTGTSNTPTAPTVTTTSSNTRVVRIYGADDDDLSATPYPSGHTGRFNIESNGGNGTCSAGAADQVQAAAGATGTAAFTLDASEEWRGVTLAIRPAPVAPTAGHWELRVDQSSAATAGDDINAFGIRAHDGTPGAGGTELNVYYDSHTAYGVNDNDGAANSRTYTVYPWVTSGCTCTERDFDYDSNSGTVGSVVLYGRSGTQRANFASGVLSANDVWAANTVPRWGDNSNATDYGIWRAVASISTYTTPAMNSNYSNIYFGNDQAAAPPPTANPTANTFRVYLPTDAGAAPLKPYLEQQVRYRSGATTVADNTETIVTVTVRLYNPTGSALTFGSPSSNAITSYIPGGQATCYQTNCRAETNYGTFTTPAAGGSGTVTWAPGTVPAGATAALRYDVRIYPTVGGANPIPVTGTPAANGTRATYLDETGNTAQTRATVTLGPLCDLNVARGLLTEAVLSGVAAFRHRDGVLVRWETASEVGTAGFRLLRWEPSAKDFVDVGEEPAPALPEAPQGAAYEVVDRDADPRTSQIYRLVEIELSGNQRDLGTFELEPQNDTERWGAAAPSRVPWPARPEPPLPALPTPGGQPAGAVGAKIAVATDGLYFLSTQALAPVLGLSPAEVQARILGGTVALSNQSASVAWLAAQGGSGLYFYGRGIDNPFTVHNVYRLALARGVRMQNAVTTPPAGSGLLSSRTTRHFEIDRYPVINGPLDAEGDFWFQDYLIAGDATQGRKPAVLDLPAGGASSGQAILTANLFGMSASGVSGEHHARVFVNGVQVAEQSWEGITPLAVVAPFSQTLLRDGGNTIEVEALKDPGVPFSYVYIDSFDVTYERRHEAEASALQVSTGSLQGVTVAGFTDASIRVFDVTNARAPKLVTQARIEPSGSAFQATFTSPKSSSRVLLASDSGVMTPSRIWRDNPSSLRTGQNSADYVVITAPELVASAEGLAELRRRTGLRAQVVDLEDIYDEFHFGVPSPRAIQSFLAYAKGSWRPGPSMVVLAGAGTYDYKNLLGLGGNLVPPLLVSTQRGMFSSDALLADVSGAPLVAGNGLLGPTTVGDGVPDLAIGRLPVTTPEELAAQVAKIAAFEQSKAGEWAGRALLVADNPDKGVDFGSENDSLAPLLPGTLAIDRAYLGPLSLAKARDVLLGQWSSGTALVNYFGHGGHDRWATEGLLVGTDVAALNNAERLPLVTSMTCVIGRFEIPGLDSLGEALVRRQGGGAIAVWAPSGMGNHPDSLMLARHFTTALSSAGAMPASDSFNPSATASAQPTIGSAVVSALARFAAGGGDMTTAVLYNLLGDPAVRLRPAPSPPLPPPGGGPGVE
jgi:hypothetical protein